MNSLACMTGKPVALWTAIVVSASVWLADTRWIVIGKTIYYFTISGGISICNRGVPAGIGALQVTEFQWI
jgi:hypothetical protein